MSQTMTIVVAKRLRFERGLDIWGKDTIYETHELKELAERMHELIVELSELDKKLLKM